MNTKTRIKTVLKVAALAMMMLAVTAASASAAVILSEDFEEPVVVGYDDKTAPADWTYATQGYGSNRCGLNNDGEGNQVFSFRYTNSGVTTKEGVIGALESDVTYTISFDVAADQDLSMLAYTVQFAAFEAGVRRDDVRSSFEIPANMLVLSSASGSAPEDGSWATVSFDFIADPDYNTASIGKDLAIRIIGATSSANIDNVMVSSYGGSDPNVPAVDAGSNWVTWSGAPVTLDDVVVVNNSDPVTALVYSWSADPADGVVFSASDVESPTVTITKATDNPSVVTLTLGVTNEGSESPAVEDTMTIDVFGDACQAALASGAIEFDATDFNSDCITDIVDLAELASKWLDDYTISAPAVK